jgi:hypothetical protein
LKTGAVVLDDPHRRVVLLPGAIGSYRSAPLAAGAAAASSGSR